MAKSKDPLKVTILPEGSLTPELTLFHFFVIAQKTREGTERNVPVLITERYSKDGKLQMFWFIVMVWFYKRNIVLEFRGSSLLYCNNIVSYVQNDHTHQTIMVWFEYIGKWINCLWAPEFMHWSGPVKVKFWQATSPWNSDIGQQKWQQVTQGWVETSTATERKGQLQ